MRLVAPATVGADDIARVRAMTTEALRVELVEAFERTVRHLRCLATVWAELEGRGEDMTDLKSSLLEWLPLIASDATYPETVLRFYSRPGLLRTVASLPKDVQWGITTGEPVLVVERQGSGFSNRMLPVHALAPSLMRQVFADRRVRTEREQIAYLTARGNRPQWEPVRPVLNGKVRVDRAAGTVRVGRTIVPAVDVIDALRAAGMI